MSAAGPAIAILAAGASSRMRGRDKLLETVDGEPLLRRVARRCVETGLWVCVTLPASAPRREVALEGLALSRVAVADAAEGMAASLRAAIGALPRAAPGLMVVLADMPELESGDLAALAAAWAQEPDAVARAADAQGRPGQPVVLPRRLFGEVARLRGDAGARGLLAAESVRLHPLPGRRATTDLDTPEAWEAWRSGRR